MEPLRSSEILDEGSRRAERISLTLMLGVLKNLCKSASNSFKSRLKYISRDSWENFVDQLLIVSNLWNNETSRVEERTYSHVTHEFSWEGL